MSGRNSVVVNDDGNDAIPHLARGQYTLTAEYTGFNNIIRTGIALETGQAPLDTRISDYRTKCPQVVRDGLMHE